MRRPNAHRLLPVVFCVAVVAVAHARICAFEIHAHRGGNGEVAPGNTLPAFEHALDSGVDTLELDVRLTRDDVIVVMHEDVLPDGWTGLEETDGFDQGRSLVRKSSLNDLKKLRHRIRRLPTSRFEGGTETGIILGRSTHARIPSLGEVFDFVADYSRSDIKTEQQRKNAARVRFCIEMKEPGFEAKLVRLIEKRDHVVRVIVQSFDFDSLNRVPELNRNIDTMALTYLPINPDRVRRECPRTRYWGPLSLTLTKSNTTLAHKAGFLVVPWTVNEKEKIMTMIGWGVDGLMTDFPSEFTATIKTAVRKKKDSDDDF